MPVWHGWNPLGGPRQGNSTRKVFQVLVPYNMTRLPFACKVNATRDTKFTSLPMEMMLWPLNQDETCLKYVNTDASIWGLESCWTQWPRDNSWENPYMHFKWSQQPNYTYADAKLQVMTLAKSAMASPSYWAGFAQRTFRNMSYYGYLSETNKTKSRWWTLNQADWSATPWGPTSSQTSYSRGPSTDWSWRYTGSFWYSNFHFPMVTEMARHGDFGQGTIRGRHHWGNNQCLGQCNGL
jgi:hypothetical protein